MKSIKQIIWDWNGTLLDDAWLCVQSMNKVLQRRQMPELTSARYQEVFDFPVIKYYELLGFDFKKEPFTIVGTEFINEYYKNSHKLDLQEGAKKVFNTIKEKGTEYPVQVCRSMDMYRESDDYLPSRVNIAAIWNYDGYKNETSFSVVFDDQVTENDKNKIVKHFNGEFYGNNLIIIQDGLSNKLQ